MAETLLALKGLTKTFPVGKHDHLRAVRSVDLTLHRGESLGIVGESGCGKSTIARMVAQLTEVTDGQILFEGRDVTRLSRSQRRELWRNVQMVFQDPYSVFSPRMTVGDFLTEGLVHFGIASRSRALVGSSASSSLGLNDIAMAMPTRWRIPPDSSKG